jgi:hypothetical protein
MFILRLLSFKNRNKHTFKSDHFLLGFLSRPIFRLASYYSVFAFMPRPYGITFRPLRDLCVLVIAVMIKHPHRIRIKMYVGTRIVCVHNMTISAERLLIPILPLHDRFSCIQGITFYIDPELHNHSLLTRSPSRSLRLLLIEYCCYVWFLIRQRIKIKISRHASFKILIKTILINWEHLF